MTDRDYGTAARRMERVAVIGAGTIGASWTALFLAAGPKVAVYDPAEDAEDNLAAYLQTAWPSLQDLGLARGDLPPTPALLATLAAQRDAKIVPATKALQAAETESP